MATLTWSSSYPSLQTRSSGADLVRSSLTHGPYSELEGASGDMLAPVLDVDGVRSHFLGDEPYAVGAVPSVHDVGVHRFPTGAGDLSRHGLSTTLDCRRQKSRRKGESYVGFCISKPSKNRDPHPRVWQ